MNYDHEMAMRWHLNCEVNGIHTSCGELKVSKQAINQSWVWGCCFFNDLENLSKIFEFAVKKSL